MRKDLAGGLKIRWVADGRLISVRNALLRKDVFKMFEIKGKITTAICYAKVVEDEAIGQIRRMCDYDLTKGKQGTDYA